MVAQNMLRKYDKHFPKKKIRFDDSFGVTKCLQQIEIPDLFHTCAPCAELSSTISTMLAPNPKLMFSNYGNRLT